jgi:hypothetical protein
MAVNAEERDVQGFVIIPVMAFQPKPAPTPRAAFRSGDKPELLTERRGITSRARSDAPGAKEVEADFEVSAETCELGVLAVPSAFFHVLSYPCWDTGSPRRRR